MYIPLLLLVIGIALVAISPSPDKETAAGKQSKVSLKRIGILLIILAAGNFVVALVK